MVSRIEGQRGFAIVEVLIAIAVVTVLAVGMSGGERQGLATARAGFEETAALGLLQERLDALRGAAARLPLGTRNEPGPAELPALAEVRVEETLVLVEPGLLEARVEIRWRPLGAASSTSRSATTWIAREEGR
jgi:prepilin-type N-terminal cleavage/methylation domain-containing protein